jgi:hypothetical protein
MTQRGYTADSFFNGMFLTPPYPSTVQFETSQGCTELARASDKNFYSRLAVLAAPYPAIKMGIDVAFDASNTTQWGCFISFLNFLGNSTNPGAWGFVGPDMEHFPIVTTHTILFGGTWSGFLTAMSRAVTEHGWAFVGLQGGGYPQTPTITWLAGATWPRSPPVPVGDSPTFINENPYTVGVNFGFDGGSVFPSIGCDYDGVPYWTVTGQSIFPEGYLPALPVSGTASCHNPQTNQGFTEPTIDQWMAINNNRPVANAQWNILMAGHNARGFSDNYRQFKYFTGVSGVTTEELWDNPLFRAEMATWLASNPNTYLTSNGAVSASTITSVTLTCSRSSVIVGKHVRCSAKVIGSSPTGVIIWSSSSSGRFLRSYCSLVRSTCADLFTPTSARSETTLTARYAGDSRNSPSSAEFSLAVSMKTSRTTLTCRPTSVVAGSSTVISCKAKVIGYLPTGTVTWSQEGDGKIAFASTTCTLSKGRCSTTMTGIAYGKVIINETYGGDPNNTSSSRARSITILPRT